MLLRVQLADPATEHFLGQPVQCPLLCRVHSICLVSLTVQGTFSIGSMETCLLQALPQSLYNACFCPNCQSDTQSYSVQTPSSRSKAVMLTQQEYIIKCDKITHLLPCGHPPLCSLQCFDSSLVKETSLNYVKGKQFITYFKNISGMYFADNSMIF